MTPEWLPAVPAFLALGAVAGVLAGLLGIGGGLVLVAALAWLLPSLGIPAEAAMHAALATALASVVFTGSASARAHHRRGSVLWRTVGALVPGLLLGAWFGSLFATALPGAALRWIVAGYCVLAAAQLLFGRPRVPAEGEGPPRGPLMWAAGGVIGAVSAVVGIGGGSMTVPLLVARGVEPVRAVGTSSACGVFIAVGGALGYMAHAPAGSLPSGGIGYVYLPAAIAVALASVLTAPLGTRLAHRIGGAALRRVFAAFLLAIAASLALG
ncbi:sulfite exporter TauE/SafE family protein [Coralloluteibacterium thermophilus]|uniref:Probable membrane transporter protein n=1 Tax=Coralloluteibacterium thermophilum TaxID=2707049 RepID=A0ABV9NJ44_9GAMM